MQAGDYFQCTTEGKTLVFTGSSREIVIFAGIYVSRRTKNNISVIDGYIGQTVQVSLQAFY